MTASCKSIDVDAKTVAGVLIDDEDEALRLVELCSERITCGREVNSKQNAGRKGRKGGLMESGHNAKS